MGLGDEYSNLIQFIQDEAAKARRGGDEDEDQTTLEHHRTWYMPWKVTTFRVDRNGEKVEEQKKVPASWLETSLQTGLSDAEVTKRRGDFGFNELER